MNTEKVEELRLSAEQLAKQALETAELGLRAVREQFESAGIPTDINLPGGDVRENLQQTAFAVENKAKEMFTLATHFMQELNNKWQPQSPASTEPEAESRPKAAKIDIED
jgi:hypothetical protein